MKIFKIIFSIYILQIIIYFIGPINYDLIPIKSILILLLLNASIFLGYKARSPRVVKSKEYYISPNLGRIFLVFSLLGIVLRLWFKIGELGFTGLFSLDRIIELRLDKSFSNAEKGQSIVGVMGTMFVGFSFVYIALKTTQDRIGTRRLSAILFFISCAMTLLEGGRFGVLIGLMYYFLLKSLYLKNKHSISKRKRRAIQIISVVFIITVSQIFLIKLGIHDDNIVDAVLYSTNKKLRYEIPFINDNVAGLIYMYDYYFSHSLYELEVFVNEYSYTTIYWGQYQFYPYFMFLSKLGLDFVSIDEILRVIPNPGVYSSIWPAFFIDFGVFAPLAFILLGFLFGQTLFFKGERKFINILFSMVLIFSPIISVVGASIFPSIIFATMVYQIIYYVSRKV